jgi:hypothetical protein
MLGEQPRRNLISRSLTNVLEAAEQRRIHSIAIPIIGATTESSNDERNELVEMHVEAAVSHLRRHNSRFDTISFVSRFSDDAPLVALALEQARLRSWVE